MKLIYLCSPYSHKDPEVMAFRETEITRVAAQLTEMYPEVALFLPITQSAPMARMNKYLNGDFKTWANIDLFIVGEKADEVWVVMMEGWNKSIGVLAEIEHALKTHKPVKYIDSNTLEFVNEKYHAIHQ